MTPQRKLIKQQRELLGFSLADVANRIGVSIAAYRDVEWYDDELTRVLPLERLRLLAKVLGLELELLVGTRSRAERSSAARKPPDVRIAEGRRQAGVPGGTMPKDIGFDETFVRLVETDDWALEAYSYDDLKRVADYLKLDAADLLDAPPRGDHS